MAIQVKNDNVLISHINELESSINSLDSRITVAENNFAQYLPLTGGGLTGPVTSNSSITASGGFIGNASTATTWKTARTLTIGASGKSVNGSSNISYTPFEMKLSRALYNTDTNLNTFAQHGHATGMCNLGSNGAIDNPGGKTGWHHVFQATWSDTADNNNSTTNEWCTQIANACGSTDLYVRSRNGGTISDGTAWSAPWVLLATTVEKGTYYVRFNNGLQICWGTVGLPKLGANATGSTAVTLAKAFKDTAYGISFVQRTDPGNTWHTGICSVSKTTSGMTVSFRNGHSGALSGTGGVYEYIAVGWWK